MKPEISEVIRDVVIMALIMAALAALSGYTSSPAEFLWVWLKCLVGIVVMWAALAMLAGLLWLFWRIPSYLAGGE